MVDLIIDVFTPVYERVLEKKADLIGKQKKPTHGFEPSWFTPLVKKEMEKKDLGPTIHQIGADITFRDGTKLELKAESGFHFSWIIDEGALKHEAPVLFLCNGTNKIKIDELQKRPDVRVLYYKYLNDGKDDWILGLIDPIQFYIDKYHGRELMKEKRKTEKHQDGNKIFKKRPQKNYPPQLRKSGSYQDFNDLKDHLENAPDSRITMCMDKALLEGRTYDQLLEEMARNNKRLDSNDFKTISRIDGHVKYREDHDGWKFKFSGERNESNTHVRLVGLRLVKSP